jgi:hypothetical protein
MKRTVLAFFLLRIACRGKELIRRRRLLALGFGIGGVMG